MTNGHATDTTVHLSDEGRLQAIQLVESGELISHPVEASVLGANTSASSHEVDDLVSIIDLIKGFFDDSSPVLGVPVVVFHRV